MTILYLVRHGETEDNVARIMQGQTQGKLTARGVEQARDVCAAMADEQIDVFMSSDLKRAIDTAEIIAAPHNKDVITTPLLRERDWGGFTGRYIPDIQNEEWPDDIETMGQLKERARSFLSHVTAMYHDKKVLAVGHGIINKVIQSVYYNKPPHEIAPMTNAEVRILEL